VKIKAQSGDLNGFLDAGSDMRGELHFEDTFRIDGHFTGTVNSSGDLIVGLGGEVEGELHVAQVFVSGTVKGKISAAKRVEVATTGRVFASIETPSLVIEDGAIFNGQCAMTKSAGSSEVRPTGPVPLSQRR
jgi:cytoskeletal protein CcmA (bactofilin family)